MYLGIEFGGTKLQLGVGAGDGQLVALEQRAVDPARGAPGLLEQVREVGHELFARYKPKAIGIGFGGPVNSADGVILKSHQIEGWDNFPIAHWCREEFGVPTALGNDCDVACLAEARWGAGRDRPVVFYITVGSGIGGGLAINGQLYRGGANAVAEIGHLRPGLHADRPEQTVEEVASGWGIGLAAQTRLAEPFSHDLQTLRRGMRNRSPEDIRQQLIDAEEQAERAAGDLLNRVDGQTERVTAAVVAAAAAEGNSIALEILDHAWQTLGWAIATTITLTAPNVVVIGGGVSKIGPRLMFDPLRRYVQRYVFPPLSGSYEILPWGLGEPVVIHGALAIAADAARA